MNLLVDIETTGIFVRLSRGGVNHLFTAIGGASLCSKIQAARSVVVYWEATPLDPFCSKCLRLAQRDHGVAVYSEAKGAY